ncbi:MAG: DUF1259 domain-containing protein [Acidobacteria bacterium]|nr:DUF1259 domain-containing protein [Acidobacteriota bacterium]
MRIMPLAAALVLALLAGPARADIDWNQLEQIFARPATEQPGGIHRFGFPRTDLTVTLDGVKISPGLALGSWIAFHPAGGDRVMVMGDLVLTEEEVNPVMKRLAEGGIEVTALHNHLLRAEPFPMYMHVEGHGDPVELARTLRHAIALSGTPGDRAGNTACEPALDIDTATIARVLGHEGKAEGGVYKVSIPRAEQITAGAMAVPPSMGTAIAINFQPVGDGKAATTGDFVLKAEEVNPVLRTLRKHGIEVTALHNHMLEEEPRLFFMHFWGVGEPGELARGLKAALDKIKLAKG